ncbi:hypothetical protein Clocel_2300 [Clostridium cellulovorans 743B]|uniref:Sensor histidine kinase NatK-like C-terminal domain-containing protein n=1 Tax=Clostridium cellulovorans (strain ATCC 35296 / DSM 3052 / OCM 3 / 743B) TaxID=573061 RepID=D9SP61_CLOC7|nr:hypothetical protein Clocel_2300 [Clostridium cellulovorans 743B]
MTQFFWSLFELSANIFEMYLFYVVLRPVKMCKKIQLWDVLNIILFSLFLLYINHIIAIGSLATCIITSIPWFIWSIYYDNKKQIKMILFRILLVFVILLLSDSFFLLLPQMILNINPKILIEQNLHRIIFVIITKCFSYFCVKYIPLPKEGFILRKPMYFYSISILFLIDSISSLILMRSILNLESPIQQLNSESLFFSFIIFVFNASILVVGVLFIALVDKEIYSKIVQEGYERQKDIIRELELNISSINKNQHEYGNNLSTVNALLINNQVDKARAFLHETLNINNEVTKLIRKSTSFAEIIVNYKLEEAVSKGIKVDSSIDISNDVPINQYDIAILLNNAFNNAIEACMKVAPTARYIKCSIYLKLGYLNFYFENSCIGDYKIIDGKLETSKIDSTNHGIGLQNIEYIVNKYDGFMKYQLENDKFVLKCSLLIESSFMDECLG